MSAEIVYGSALLASLIGWATLRRPILTLPILVAVSLLVGEFYPLSNYPMYGNPGPTENYLYLATFGPDGELAPLPVRRSTGVSAPRVKKMYKSALRARTSRTPPPDRKVPVDREAGLEVLAHLRAQADVRGVGLPDPIALVEVRIAPDLGRGYRERTRVVAVSEIGTR